MKYLTALITLCILNVASPLVAKTSPEVVVIAPSGEQTQSNYPSIARLADDRLLCVYTVVTHSPSGIRATIEGKFSQDHGRSWGDPIVLIDSSPDLDYDASIVVTGERVIVLSTTVPPTHGQFISTSRTLAVRSEDSGKTWSDPYQIPMTQRYVAGKINNGIDLGDNALIFGYAWDVMLEKQEAVGSEGAQDYHCGIKVSNDGGMTWVDGPYLAITAPKTAGRTHAINGIDEPAIVELPDKSLYMLCRTGVD
jgi:hypothetical protein